MLSADTLDFLAYVVPFAVATGGCLAALTRARRVDDPETRRGLVWLFAGSGGWAGLILGFLVVDSPLAGRVLYLASLVVGLTTVGGWLYFCSAYTGRSLHRNPTFRRAAVGFYLATVLVKVTNPLHGLYYTTSFVAEPFPHLTVQHGLFHWLVTGVSYSLAAIGFFMLYEMFAEADYDTRPLAALAGVTALPVVLDVLGFASPLLIDVNYEPLGVAVFAVGVLFVFNDRFLAVQLTAGVDQPMVHVDREGRVRECNDRARRLFPALAGARGDPLEAVVPEVAAAADGEPAVLDRRVSGETRYYLLSETSFALGGSDVGALLMFADVTESERRRQELERHNEQLEWFASGIRHELRNSLQAVDGWVDTAGDALDEGSVAEAREHLRRASEHSERMGRLVGDFAELAELGQTAETDERLDLTRVANAAFRSVGPGTLRLDVERGGTVRGNPEHLQRLLERVVEFAAHVDASGLSVRRTDEGFAVTVEGYAAGDVDPEGFFEHGTAVPDAHAGSLLPNVRVLARVQGWSVRLDPEDRFRLRVTGARTAEPVDA